MTNAKLRWLTMDEACGFINEKLSGDIDGFDFMMTAIASLKLSLKGNVTPIPVSSVSIHFEVISYFRDNSAKDYFELGRLRDDDINNDEPLNNIFARICRNVGDHDDWITQKDGFLVSMLPDDEATWYILSNLEVREMDLKQYMQGRLFWEREILDGRSRREFDWLVLCSAFIALERDGRLSEAEFSSVPKLSAEARRLSGEGLDQRTIRRDVRVLYELFVRSNGDAQIGLHQTRSPDFDMLALVSRADEVSKGKL